jgi:hypothetical protein
VYQSAALTLTSIVSCTKGGGLVKVLISTMSFLFRAASAFSAASRAGRTCKCNGHEQQVNMQS